MSGTSTKIRRLTIGDATSRRVKQVNHLLQQLSTKSETLTPRQFEWLCCRSEFTILGAINQRQLVGIASLKKDYNLGGVVYRIDDVVVDRDMRGQGIGRRLLEELLNQCLPGSYIQLSSGRQREEARALYESLGFTIRDSDIFELIKSA